MVSVPQGIIFCISCKRGSPGIEFNDLIIFPLLNDTCAYEGRGIVTIWTQADSGKEED